MTKKRRRHTPEQIIRKLEEGHRQLAAGKELDEIRGSLFAAEQGGPIRGIRSAIVAARQEKARHCNESSHWGGPYRLLGSGR